MTHGIDTASYQGVPDWNAVKGAGISFAYVKASEGASSYYPTLDQQFGGARAAGVAVGVYHYAKPALSPEANADAFAAQIKRVGALAPGCLPPCLDLEEGSGDLSGWAKRFVDRLRQQTGARRVMVYSGASFFQTRIGEAWMDADVAVWIAHYGRTPGQPAYLTPRVALHQFASDGQITGINGNVDRNFAIWTLDKIVGAPGPSGSPSSPSTTSGRSDNVLDNIVIAPGAGGQRVGCTVGRNSLTMARAWISAVVEGPDTGSVHFWFQDDQGGVADAGSDIVYTKGHSARVNFEVPDGTTQINVTYNFPQGGTLFIEGQSK